MPFWYGHAWPQALQRAPFSADILQYNILWGVHAGPKQPTAERGLSTRQDQHGPAHESCSIAPAAPGNEPSLPASSSEHALQACSFRARRGWSLQVACTCTSLIAWAAALCLQAYMGTSGAEVLLQCSLPSA